MGFVPPKLPIWLDAYESPVIPLDSESEEILKLQRKLKEKERELQEALKRQMVEPDKPEHRRLELEKAKSEED